MPTYLFITFVLLAIYKSLSNRAALLPRCCLCPFAPYTHTDRYCYSFQIPTIIKDILATSVFPKPLLTDSTDCTDCINHGWNAVFQDLEAGFISHLFILFVRFRTGCLPGNRQKSLEVLGNEKITGSFFLSTGLMSPSHCKKKHTDHIMRLIHRPNVN